MVLTPEQQRRSRMRRMNLLMAYAALSAKSNAFPLSLFSAGEQGAWYDPSDLTTMFQDSVGATPVTAAGDPVGLILDKSRGLVLGSELGRTSLQISDLSAAPYYDFTDLGDRIRITRNAAAYTGGSTPTWIETTSQALGAQFRLSFSIVGISAGAEGFYSARVGGGTSILTNTYPTSPVSVTRTVAMPAAGPLRISVGVARSNAPSSALQGDWIEIGKTISIRELPGNHARQSTTGARPVLRQDANSRWYLEFDGTDDSLSTGTINLGSVDKAQVFAGVRKLSDASIQLLYELSSDLSSNNGTFWAAPGYSGSGSVVGAYWNVASKGTSFSTAITAATFSAPQTIVQSHLADISGDSLGLRVNGSQVAQSVADQGTGNFLSYPLFIGSRGGATNYFSGWLYGLIIRFSGANLDDATIAQAETWMNGKTGAY